MLDTLIDHLRSLISMRSVDPDIPVLDEDTLDDRVEEDEGVIVLFYADWCGFCRAFIPTFEDEADDLPMDAVAADVSDYEDPRWEAYDVDTVPTVIAFQEGQPIARADAQAGRGLRAEDLDQLAERVPA